MHSRVASATVVGQAIAACTGPPRVWLQASTATIYAHRFDAPNDEATGIIGGHEGAAPASWGFSIEVATAWERAAQAHSVRATRLLLLRSAMIMSPDRGGIFALLLRLVRFGLGGPVAGGRQYVSWIHDRDFVRTIYWLIAHPELSGAIPARLVESGFHFDYPDWPAAAADLVHRVRSSRWRRFWRSAGARLTRVRHRGMPARSCSIPSILAILPSCLLSFRSLGTSHLSAFGEHRTERQLL